MTSIPNGHKQRSRSTKPKAVLVHFPCNFKHELLFHQNNRNNYSVIRSLVEEYSNPENIEMLLDEFSTLPKHSWTWEYYEWLKNKPDWVWGSGVPRSCAKCIPCDSVDEGRPGNMQTDQHTRSSNCRASDIVIQSRESCCPTRSLYRTRISCMRLVAAHRDWPQGNPWRAIRIEIKLIRASNPKPPLCYWESVRGGPSVRR